MNNMQVRLNMRKLTGILIKTIKIKVILRHEYEYDWPEYLWRSRLLKAIDFKGYYIISQPRCNVINLTGRA